MQLQPFLCRARAGPFHPSRLCTLLEYDQAISDIVPCTNVGVLVVPFPSTTYDSKPKKAVPVEHSTLAPGTHYALVYRSSVYAEWTCIDWLGTRSQSVRIPQVRCPDCTLVVDPATRCLHWQVGRKIEAKITGPTSGLSAGTAVGYPSISGRTCSSLQSCLGSNCTSSHALCSRKKRVGRRDTGPPHVLFPCWRAQQAVGMGLLLLLRLQAMADRGKAQIGVHQRLEERDV